MATFFQIFNRLDNWLFGIINQRWSREYLDSVMLFFSYPGKIVFAVVGLTGILGLIKGGRKGRMAVLLSILSIAITDPATARLIKPWTGRERPNHPEHLALQVRPINGYNSSNSYPSSHAANISGVAAILTRVYPQGFLVWASVAFLVCYSRVYLAQHFPLDVIGGALFGIWVATLLYGLSHWFTFRSRDSI